MLRRRYRGFTLIELIVCSAMASVLAGFMFQWVTSTMNIANASLTQASTARATRAVDLYLTNDLSHAAACGSGAASPIRSLTPTTLELYISRSDEVTGAASYLVRYEQTGTLLTRTMFLLDDTCRLADGPGASYGRRTLAAGTQQGDATRPVFTGHLGGAPIPGECATEERTLRDGTTTHTTEGPACAATSVSVSVTVAPLGPTGARDQLSQTYPIRQSAAGAS